METSTIIVVVGTLFGIVVSGGSIITFWMNFSNRIAEADAKAEAAETAANNASITVAAARLEMERLKAELVEHRVAVAKEYVSKDTLATLESRVIDAINSLGQRLDKLFQQNSGVR